MYRCFGKRLLDIFVAVTGTICLSPLLLITAIAIRLTDPGPVLFVRRRVGQNGKLFDFYKFRSMPVNTRDTPSDELGDVRLSQVGRVIRRTNIDELPQLFNVLVGDMSIVGPRPPMPTQDELVQLRTENGALICKPGLTGLAQIHAFDGMRVDDKARYDGEYVRNITVWHDLLIILETFGYLLKKPPVY